MPAPAIEVRSLSKRFGKVHAVEDLTFTAQPGRVTGFLGPNGAGKSTTLRALVGLVTPTSGDVLIGGERYHALDRPAATVGAHFEGAFHPGRSARGHLMTYAPHVGVGAERCQEVLDLVGLTEAADRRVSGYSMGMKQRLGLATALLGDPEVLVLDESANGLDPAGVQWLRGFLRAFASRGGTVLLSSHLLSEVELTVDDVVIVARGKLRHSSSMEELRDLTSSAVELRSPDVEGLADLINTRYPDTGRLTSDTTATIEGHKADAVGAAAFADRLELHELRDTTDSLETVFLRLTQEGDHA
ncbi:ATP-binding cassette domain-containing protein [Demequina sp. B12]|uniref:ABC transporter ATP-binding protein n=1 Tax=Demequina sp. B12 TaxID=2992757 RepID=UPI00237AC307|nr:ATP-binding cassette domain-containing protein [Demequina sp. B12]MDE0573846.1 ATP-binding cassette domain-containing protein [Demequina sp. B12]